MPDAGIDGANTDACRVSFRRLTLTDFRSYRNFSIELPPRMVVITGENGSGKTNLLEALSLFSPGRGLRRAKLSEMQNSAATSSFSIHGELEGPLGGFQIGTGTPGEDTSGDVSRKIRINGATAKTASELLEWVRISWMTPAMDGLFTGPSSDRRRFLDRMVLAIDANHARRTVAYEKAMRNRNRLLTDNIRDDRWFDAIELAMSESGVAIAAARAELIRVLQNTLDAIDMDGPFPRSVLSLSGALENRVDHAPSVDIETWFAGQLADSRALDRAAGRTLEGPHRTDLEVRHGPKNTPANVCSTGEQKALLVGLVLAHARLSTELTGMAPVLLLDEIAAHFDAGRRSALFDIIEAMHCQAFMTGTEPAPFKNLQGRAGFVVIESEGGHSKLR